MRTDGVFPVGASVIQADASRYYYGRSAGPRIVQRIADVLAKEKAQLWINHDKAQRDSLKMSPEFYE